MEKNVTVLFDSTNNTTREAEIRERLFKKLAEINGYESADEVAGSFIEEEIEYENKVMLENLNEQLEKILSESSIIIKGTCNTYLGKVKGCKMITSYEEYITLVSCFISYKVFFENDKLKLQGNTLIGTDYLQIKVLTKTGLENCSKMIYENIFNNNEYSVFPKIELKEVV